MFTDERRDKVWGEFRQRDLRAFAKLLTPEVLAEAGRIAGVRLGKSALCVPNLVWLGIAAAIHQSKNFAEVLCTTLKILQDLAEGTALPRPPRQNKRGAKGKNGSKHKPQGSDATQVSEEAWVKARRLMPMKYWMALLVLLGDRFEAQHRHLVRWKKFRLLALDGSCLNLPRSKKLGEHFGTAQNGLGKCLPQARLVMLQLPLVRLPWRYELCPLSVGERTVASRLVQDLFQNDLVLMDQGFWSFGLFWEIQHRGAYFGIRLHPQARPKTVRSLGKKDRLVRWKKPSGPRWCGGDWPASIDLRIIDYQIRGFRPSAVVTNVLDPNQISRDDWVRLATQSEPGRRLQPGLYHRRWEVETTFHELKVRQGMEGGLRSQTPAAIAYEVAGHVLLYFLVRWLIVESAVSTGESPLRLSFKHALQELRDLIPALVSSSERFATQVLMPRLLARIASHRVPLRPGRHFPRPHDVQIKHTGRGSKIKLPHKLSKFAA